MEEPEEREHVAKQYLAVIAPLAARFGIFVEKNVLDERCFQILHPFDYREIKHLLADYQRRSKKHVDQVSNVLRELLKQHDFTEKVEGRFKNLQSVHQKIQKKKKTLLELHDIFAFRIILEKDDPEACFDVLNLLHDTFLPIVTRFKDYISIPKINGYQSIHTCLRQVVPSLDWPVEVQIRTSLMDDFAKEGLASHWIYSQSKKSTLLSSTEIRIKQQYNELTRETALNQRVYFFSSRSCDIFSLPEGSSAHDFAYSLHSGLGERAQFAAVNGSLQRLSYLLQNGDRVEIICSAPEKPERKMNEVKTELKAPAEPRTRLYAKTGH